MMHRSGSLTVVVVLLFSLVSTPVLGWTLGDIGSSLNKAHQQQQIPKLEQWKSLDDGSVQGMVYGHPTYDNGLIITTSVLSQKEKQSVQEFEAKMEEYQTKKTVSSADLIVTTESGSKYRLTTPREIIDLSTPIAAGAPKKKKKSSTKKKATVNMKKKSNNKTANIESSSSSKKEDNSINIVGGWNWSFHENNKNTLIKTKNILDIEFNPPHQEKKQESSVTKDPLLLWQQKIAAETAVEDGDDEENKSDSKQAKKPVIDIFGGLSIPEFDLMGSSRTASGTMSVLRDGLKDQLVQFTSAALSDLNQFFPLKDNGGVATLEKELITATRTDDNEDVEEEDLLLMQMFEAEQKAIHRKRNHVLIILPRITDWIVEKDGAVSGRVYNHPSFPEGGAILTSPIGEHDADRFFVDDQDIENYVVTTISGSDYVLVGAPNETIGGGGGEGNNDDVYGP